MNEQIYRDYCIFQCNRCKFYMADPEKRPKDLTIKYRVGWCKPDMKGEEIPVIEDPKYTLINPVIPCIDWIEDKPRRK